MQYRVRETLCSASLSLYCIHSACTSSVPQSSLHTLSLYCTLSACTAHSQPVLHTLSLYCTLSTCTAHSQPVLHTLKPVLHILYTGCFSMPVPSSRSVYMGPFSDPIMFTTLCRQFKEFKFTPLISTAYLILGATSTPVLHRTKHSTVFRLNTGSA